MVEDPNYFYHYDCEGNLLFKEFKKQMGYSSLGREALEKKYGIKFKSTGTGWLYVWSANGMLHKVVNPQQGKVRFGYDALGRRTYKEVKNRRTCWLWNGNVPLHEWTALKEDPRIDIITWVFEEGSFVPVARITDDQSYSIVTDYLGTPTQMYDCEGKKTWEAQLDIYGRVRTFDGRSLKDCPFRYQGQYQDEETGLYYNRFRYYDPELGSYISKDPIGLAGNNPTLYGYVKDVNSWLDRFGLDSYGPNQDIYALYNKADVVNGVPVEGAKPYYVGISQNSDVRLGQHTGKGRFDPKTDVKVDLHKNIDYATARAYEQKYIEDFKTVNTKNPKANQQNSFRHNRKDPRGEAFESEYNRIKKCH